MCRNMEPSDAMERKVSATREGLLKMKASMSPRRAAASQSTRKARKIRMRTRVTVRSFCCRFFRKRRWAAEGSGMGVQLLPDKIKIALEFRGASGAHGGTLLHVKVDGDLFADPPGPAGEHQNLVGGADGL